MSSQKNFNFHDYLITHAQELKKFTQDVNTLTSTALTQLQRLPISLRRRAASHNIKRLPHRFHKFSAIKAANQIKKKSRKYKRRRLNLREIYLKRQEKNKWLYTHIWHAKRFKLVNRWGWRVPYEPNQKIFRPLTKAMRKGCAMVDISYFSTLEIIGQSADIKARLMELMPSTTTAQAMNRLDQGRQVWFVMHTRGSWPFGAIAPCKLMKISADSSDSSQSAMLLSCHPAARDQVLSALGDVLELEQLTAGHWLSQCRRRALRDRSAEFSRFLLLGPDSQTLAMKLLACTELEAVPLRAVPHDFVLEGEVINLASHRAPLKQTDIERSYMERRAEKAATTKLSESVRELRSTSTFASSADLVATLMAGNTSALPTAADANPFANDSTPPLQEACPVLATRVHYLAAHAPGGWELLIPAQWALSFWTTLVSRGARPSGLRYWSRFCAIEASSLLAKHDCYPGLAWPDTQQGRAEAAASRDQQLAKWKRCPPSKRVNYAHHGTADPFECAWDKLLPPAVDADAADSVRIGEGCPPFFVWRDFTFLVNAFPRLLDGRAVASLADLDEFCAHARRALMPVVLESRGGTLQNCAAIMAVRLDEDPAARHLEHHQPDEENEGEPGRPLLGFVETADQCQLVGRSRAFGFVSLFQLVRVGSSHRPARTVWVKNTHSRALVPATLTACTH